MQGSVYQTFDPIARLRDAAAAREAAGLAELEAAWAELMQAVSGLFRGGTWLTISGSMPRGLREQGYRDLVAEAMTAGLRVALDAVFRP